MNYEIRVRAKKNSIALILCVFSVLSFLFASTNAAAQENFTITNYFTKNYRDFQMMKISIVPPDGFVKDTDEVGFIDIKHNAAIRAQRIPKSMNGASADFFQGFDSVEHKDSLGMKLLQSLDFKINGFPAHLTNLSGKVEGDDYIEWRLLIGDTVDTYIVTAFIPSNKKKILEQKVRAALLSVFYEPDRRLIPPGTDPSTTSSNACGCHTKK